MSRRYVPARKPHSPTVRNKNRKWSLHCTATGLGRPRGITAALILLAVTPFLYSLRQDTNISADQLARRVIRNELKVRDEDHSHWMYRVEQEKSGRDEVWQIIETKDGDLGRLLAVNGRPLSREEQRKEDWRIQRLVTDPEEQKRLQKARNNDSDEAMSLLQTLPDAFLFNYVSHRGELVEMQFRPNPNFEPPSREAHIFHQMEGRMWVNTSALRLVQIEGHLTHDVKFAGGLLGHLERGGSFEVQQAEVAPGHWDVTVLIVNMRGKVLFFKTIGVQEKEWRSDFHRVPDNLTLAQAADILRNQAVVAMN